MEGFGLFDGETMERMWSYLRCFSKITKEMTPSHRIEQLTHALLHYTRRKIFTMSKLCVKSCIIKETFRGALQVRLEIKKQNLCQIVRRRQTVIVPQNNTILALIQY